MATLGNPRETIEILNKYRFVFQKKYGQNFLIDTHVLEKIIAAADIGKDDFVLEIGPGIGTMTQYLCERAREVVAVEIDKTLIPILTEDTLKEYKNVTVINEDIMKLDIKRLVEERNGGAPIKIVANLPYYITTPIIMMLFETHIPVQNVTVMVQKEVAERMQAKPSTKDYGALSLAVQYYAEPYIVANVPQNCFMPRPNVGSAVIRLTLHEKPPVTVRNEKLMFKLIRASFNQRRKTLQNGLNNSQELCFSKEAIANAISAAGLREDVRGETLPLEKFAFLADVLGEMAGRISCPNILSTRQKMEIEELNRICNEHDSTSSTVYLSSDMNFDEEMKCFYLYTLSDGCLGGFLSVFSPAGTDAEITGFVRPEFRRRGIFSELKGCALKEISKHISGEVYAVVESASTDGACAASSMGYEKEYSECLLRYEGNTDIVCSCEGVCLEMMEEGDERLYRLMVDGAEIGTAGVHIGERSCCIFGVVIEQTHRGKGYGKQLVALLQKKLIEESREREILLQVSSHNSRAKHIYLEMGFKVCSQMDYYKVL